MGVLNTAQMMYINALTEGGPCPGKEWLLNKVAAAYSLAEGDGKDFLKELYVVIKNATKEEMNDIIRGTPFPV